MTFPLPLCVRKGTRNPLLKCSSDTTDRPSESDFGCIACGEKLLGEGPTFCRSLSADGQLKFQWHSRTNTKHFNFVGVKHNGSSE